MSMFPQSIENWKTPAIVSLMMLAAVTIASIMSGLWLLTAIPIGFLSGFFLEKDDIPFLQKLVTRPWKPWQAGIAIGVLAAFYSKPPGTNPCGFFRRDTAGAGAGVSGARIVSNVVSGFALMSLGSILFGFTVLLANWATTFFYQMGGSWRA